MATTQRPTGIPSQKGTIGADTTGEYLQTKPTTTARPATETRAPQTQAQPNTAALQGLHTVVNESLASLTTQSKMYGGDQYQAELEKAPAASSTKWMLPNELGPEEQQVVAALKQIVTCRTMADHYKAFANVAENIKWDAPPVLLRGREAMRCMVYLAKFAATLDFDLLAAKKEILDARTSRLWLEVIVYVRPLFPLNLTLPNEIPIRADVCIGVVKSPNEPAGSFGAISLLYGRWHNWPIIPTPFRFLSGLTMGYATKLTEGLWSKSLPLFGDNSVAQYESAGPAARSAY